MLPSMQLIVQEPPSIYHWFLPRHHPLFYVMYVWVQTVPVEVNSPDKYFIGDVSWTIFLNQGKSQGQGSCILIVATQWTHLFVFRIFFAHEITSTLRSVSAPDLILVYKAEIGLAPWAAQLPHTWVRLGHHQLQQNDDKEGSSRARTYPKCEMLQTSEHGARRQLFALMVDVRCEKWD